MHRIPSGGGFWQAVTGGVEGNEDIKTTALREFREETGFTPDSIEKIDYSYNFPVEENMRKLYDQPVSIITETVFLARISGITTPCIDPVEHDNWRWCSFEEAIELLYWPGNRESLRHCEARLKSDKNISQ